MIGVSRLCLETLTITGKVNSMSEKQLELFKVLSKDREYIMLGRYRVAIPMGNHWQNTLDLFLASKTDYTTKISDLHKIMSSESDILNRGYTIIPLLIHPTSHYADWKSKQKSFAKRRGYNNPTYKGIKEEIYVDC